MPPAKRRFVVLFEIRRFALFYCGEFQLKPRPDWSSSLRAPSVSTGRRRRVVSGRGSQGRWASRDDWTRPCTSPHCDL